MNNYIIYYTSTFYYPVLPMFSLIHTSCETLPIPYIKKFKNTLLNFSDKTVGCSINENVVYINIAWLSIIENSYYAYQKCIKIDDYLYENIVIELGPKGLISILNCDKNNAVLKIHDTSINLDSESEKLEQYILNEYRAFFVNNNLNLLREKYISIFELAGYDFSEIIQRVDVFYKRFRQYNYRYTLLFDTWNLDLNCWQNNNQDNTESNIEELNDVLFDGGYCMELSNNMLFNIKGKPFMIKIKWNDNNNNDYYAFYWMCVYNITEIFERFYGAHPDTKTDFIIRIDAENKKYELALYRQGLKEPQIIPEDAYQLLVFKNKFEDYRSDNYNQERGAWIW